MSTILSAHISEDNNNNGAASPRLSDEDNRQMKIEMLNLLYDPPVENCELRPYVLLSNQDGKTIAVKDNDPTVQYQWFRGQKRICSVKHCSNGALFQCLACVKGKLPAHKAYFCSNECWIKAWPLHRSIHKDITNNWNSDDDNDDDDDDDDNNNNDYENRGNDTAKAVSSKFPPKPTDIWAEISQSRSYVPNSNDVGRALKLEVSYGNVDIKTWLTSGVLAAPEPPPPRNLIPNQSINVSISNQGFKVLCYNVLADIYATRQLYPYCPLWALSWGYRKDLLIREILSHNADLIALQEVQADHYEQFIRKELFAAGYDGIYKRKTRTAMGDNVNAIDGCAIFFKRERFNLIEQYGIDFNEAARQKFSGADRKSLRRLMKGNVALIAVLEEHPSRRVTTHRRVRKRRLCFTNTHIFWDPEFAEIKLWQTWILCQELEKLVRRSLPLILCGDFNSTPDSSVYQLLTQRMVSRGHKDLQNDPCNILPPLEQLTSNLPLRSAYAFIGEPKYTNFTGHFVGVLDYILYSTNYFVPVNVLDVDAEENVSKETALPSRQYPSDHCSLVVNFDWIQNQEMNRSLRHETEFKNLGSLGSGAFGEVFKAKNIVDGQVYAIKRIRLVCGESAREKLLREATILASMNHGNITRYFNAWVEGGSCLQHNQKKKDLKKQNSNIDSVSIASSNTNSGVNDDDDYILHGDSVLRRDVSISYKSNVRPLLANDDDDDMNDQLQNEIDRINEWNPLANNIPIDSPNDHDQSESQQSTKGNNTNYGDEGDYEPDLECNICHQVYSDWDIAFQDWNLIDVSLQPLNLCEECYLLILKRMGVRIEDVTIRRRMKRPLYLYIQMEYCGVTLNRYLAKPRDEKTLWSIFRQVVAGLQYMHNRRIVHRDLKPSNIFVTDEKTVKIGDLGLAATLSLPLNRPILPTNNKNILENEDKNLTGGVGTLLYIAPEVINAVNDDCDDDDRKKYVYDTRADVFSLGIVLFTMFHPMHTEMERSILIERLRQGILPSKFEMKYPIVASLIHRMTDENPMNRPTSTELINLIDEIQHPTDACCFDNIPSPSVSSVSSSNDSNLFSQDEDSGIVLKSLTRSQLEKTIALQQKQIRILQLKLAERDSELKELIEQFNYA